MPNVRVNSALSIKICTSLLATALLPLAGCCHAPTLNTHVTADGHLLNETSTPGNAGPVWPFTVPRQDGACGGPAIALIDVDGLLMDFNFVGPGSAGENPVSLF